MTEETQSFRGISRLIFLRWAWWVMGREARSEWLLENGFSVKYVSYSYVELPQEIADAFSDYASGSLKDWSKSGYTYHPPKDAFTRYRKPKKH